MCVRKRRLLKNMLCVRYLNLSLLVCKELTANWRPDKEPRNFGLLDGQLETRALEKPETHMREYILQVLSHFSYLNGPVLRASLCLMPGIYNNLFCFRNFSFWVDNIRLFRGPLLQKISTFSDGKHSWYRNLTRFSLGLFTVSTSKKKCSSFLIR